MKKWGAIYLVLVTVAAVGLTALAGKLKFADDLEQATFDLRQLAFAPETSASDKIVMVWLDENTMSKLPYRSPVPRDFLTKLNDALSRAAPAAIGYDIYFKDPSFPGPDRDLVASFAKSKVYAVEPMRYSDKIGIDGIVDPPGDMFVRVLKGRGLADLPIGAFDTKVRKARLSYKTDEGITPTFAALLYNVTGGDAEHAVDASWHWPKLGPFTFIPYVDQDKSILIRFAGPPSSIGGNNNKFRVFPAHLVADGVLPAEWFKDKIVLVGAAYSDMTDAFPTPYYSRSTDFTRMNGVEIHTNVLNQLITGQFYYGFEGWQKWALIGMVALACAACALFLSPVLAGVFIFALATSIPVVSVYSFRKAGIVVPTVMPLIAVASAFAFGVVMRALAEGRQKRFIKQVFSRYVPPAVVDRIAKNPELARLGGEDRLVTSMFTDIASFTTLSEKLEPTVLVSFLNDYLGRMNKVVLDAGGTIDKYEGDAVIAFFNAPLDVIDHQERALLAAVEIQKATAEVLKGWHEVIGDSLVTRVGIHTGRAVVGNLGSEGRFDYTAIGDTINLASRLEGANKFYGTRILCSGDALSGTSSKIVTRPLDKIRVKGRATEVLIHEVIAGIESEMMNNLIKPYNEAYKLYDERKFEEAKRLFEHISGKYPNDEPTRMAIERCRRAIKNPDWDGITDLQSK